MGVQKSTVPIFSTMIPNAHLLIVQEIVLHQSIRLIDDYFTRVLSKGCKIQASNQNETIEKKIDFKKWDDMTNFRE